VDRRHGSGSTPLTPVESARRVDWPGDKVLLHAHVSVFCKLRSINVWLEGVLLTAGRREDWP
jgi:hypothetical protein